MVIWRLYTRTVWNALDVFCDDDDLTVLFSFNSFMTGPFIVVRKKKMFLTYWWLFLDFIMITVFLFQNEFLRCKISVENLSS